MTFAQLRRGLSHDGLQGREHPSLDEVPPAGCPVRQPEHDVQVEAGSVLTFGNVTDQGQYLGRLVNRDVAELPGRTVEPADRGMLEAAHGSDLRGLQALGAGELRQSRDVTRLAHDDISDDVRVLDNLGFHHRLPTEAGPGARPGFAAPERR